MIDQFVIGTLHDPVTWYRINYAGISVFKIRRRPSHPTVTFIYATPIFTLVNS